MLNYNWFMVAAGADIGMEIVNETDITYVITDPMYEHNATGYYCIASSNEGNAVSTTSRLIGNKCSVTVVIIMEFKSHKQ